MQVGQLRSAAVLLAAVAVGASYVWLMAAHGTVWLGDAVVHENGRLTFGATLGYVEHFIRELPIDILIALCLAAIIQPLVARTPRSRHIAVITTVGAILMPVAALIVATQRTGWDLVRHDLLQSVTREGAFVWGSHWHSHWLPMVCVALVATALVRTSALTVSAWAWLGVLTVMFGVGADTFTSGRFVGHQLRELVTHIGVMAPVAMGIALTGADNATPIRWRLDRRALVALGAAVLVAIALGTLSLTHGATAEIQPGAGWSAVVATHVFEHSLDYAWVALLTTAIVSWSAPRRS